MKTPVPLKVRPKAAPVPSPEVVRAKALYLRALRRRVLEGTYLTPRREETALERLLLAVREDLPNES